MRKIYIIFLILAVIFLVIFFVYKPKRGKFENTIGHIYNQTAREALEDSLKNPDAAGYFQAAEIINYNLGEPETAAFFYLSAVEYINNNPEAAVLAPINPESILDRVPVKTDDIREKIAKTRKKKFKKVNIRSDPQNVHDSGVAADTRKKLNLLIELTAGREFEKPVLTPPQEKIYQKMKNNPAFFHNITDCEIFERAWIRGSPEVRKALGAALENFEQEGHTICVTGRVSNILDSFTLLDPVLGKPVLTREIMRKRSFELAAEIAEKEIPDEVKKEEIKKKILEYFPDIPDEIIKEAQDGI